MLMYLKTERLKRETEKAYCIQCPDSSYSYAKAVFWLSKSNAKRCRIGDYSYLEVKIPSLGEVELKRYHGKRRDAEIFKINWIEVQAMFRMEHESVQRRLSAEYQNQAADRWFESQMRG